MGSQNRGMILLSCWTRSYLFCAGLESHLATLLSVHVGSGQFSSVQFSSRWDLKAGVHFAIMLDWVVFILCVLESHLAALLSVFVGSVQFKMGSQSRGCYNWRFSSFHCLRIAN